MTGSYKRKNYIIDIPNTAITMVAGNRSNLATGKFQQSNFVVFEIDYFSKDVDRVKIFLRFFRSKVILNINFCIVRIFFHLVPTI